MHKTRGSSHRGAWKLEAMLGVLIHKLYTIAQAYICSKEAVPFSILHSPVDNPQMVKQWQNPIFPWEGVSPRMSLSSKESQTKGKPDFTRPSPQGRSPTGGRLLKRQPPPPILEQRPGCRSLAQGQTSRCQCPVKDFGEGSRKHRHLCSTPAWWRPPGSQPCERRGNRKGTPLLSLYRSPLPPGSAHLGFPHHLQ